MAKPSSPSVGTRVLYYLTPSELPGGCAPHPATVNSVAGSAPDYLGMVLLVHVSDGSTRVRTGVINISSWQTAGSNPDTPRWDYLDALA